ncbi:phage major capsid protein [Geomonas agri]|uniref:phage major capsid protein n=1 Tax=Geomonas agri TaxID=2873702 RepID=UPI001CD5E11A|nr:phage major capsid protein [Geomonas agri]
MSFEALNNAFEKFIDSNDARLDRIEAGLNARMDEIEGKRNRPAAGVSNTPATADQKAHSEAFNAFARRGIDNGLLDLEIKAGMSVGSDPDGGYAVPSEIASDIEKLEKDAVTMRRIARVISIGTPNYTKLVNKGGTTSGWVGETQARPETDTPQLAALTPFWGEIYANPCATQTMLDDASFDVASMLTESISEEFTDQENTAFINGDGLLKPKGLLSFPVDAAADKTRAFGTLQFIKTGDASGFKAASATVSPADVLVDLVYSLRKPYRQGAVWLMNSNTLAVVSKWKDAVNGLPIWQRGLIEGQPSMLLGYPVEEDEAMPDIAAGAFPIAFGNFKRGFTIVDRKGIRVLRDPFTNKPNVHFYTTKRVGSFLNNSQCIKLLKISA